MSAPESPAEELERERRILFRRSPLIVAHASELARPGDFVTHDATGIPLLVTRSEAGLRAFVNVCRHRATKVVGEPAGCGRSSFVCPLHGWTYDLDGKLAGVPPDQGFAFVEVDKMGLRPVPVAEDFGLVWVLLTPDAPIDPRAFAAGIAGDLDALDLGALGVRKKTLLAQPLDWKLAVGAFLSCDAAAEVEVVGPHVRVAAHAGEPSVHFVFPNTVLLARAGDVSAFHVFPSGAGTARVVGARYAKADAIAEPPEPSPFRHDERALAAFERAVRVALDQETLA